MFDKSIASLFEVTDALFDVTAVLVLRIEDGAEVGMNIEVREVR